MSRLKSLDMRDLDKTERVPSEPPLHEETSKLAFCPLLLEYEGKSMCGRVSCKACDLPNLEYEGLETGWFCTRCWYDLKALPYWGDGKCDGCGQESSVLTLCEIPNE